MKRALVVVDMQNDFIDGSLANPAAKKIVPNIIKLLEEWNDMVFVTKDTHEENYLKTQEGKRLPVVHCIKGTPGWEINEEIKQALSKKKFHKFEYHKPTFGSIELAEDLKRFEIDEVTFVGTVTSICVVNNAMLAKAFNPEMTVKVKADCCADLNETSNGAALLTMKMSQIEII